MDAAADRNDNSSSSDQSSSTGFDEVEEEDSSRFNLSQVETVDLSFDSSYVEQVPVSSDAINLKPQPTSQKTQNSNDESINSPLDFVAQAENTPPLLRKLVLYETKTRFYLVGCDTDEEHYRILKIDRTIFSELSFIEDEAVYDRKEITQILGMISEGNKATGGLKRVSTAYGLMGFIRFLEGYYIVLITKKSQVAMLGGHAINHIDDYLIVSIAQKADSQHHPDEQRYLDAFIGIDLRHNFYFSYTYDLTHTLQHNLTHQAAGLLLNDMFVWNYYLWTNAFPSMRRSEWIVPVIHGFVDQAKISVFGKSVFITLIARRSRHFAGTRFLKRGVNQKGHVANDVETEQIVNDASNTSFCANSQSRFSAYVQHRGSIPLFWSQEQPSSPVAGLKPPIQIQRSDPFYSAGATHFDHMFKRYGTPIIALNLVKHKEKTPRESLLLKEYTYMIYYLNQFLPAKKKIKYIAWDMAKAAKSSDQDVISLLADIADEFLLMTGFFFSGIRPPPADQQLPATTADGNIWIGRRQPTLQSGVVRTNCVDCLDRTNAAQFMIGKAAFAHQIYVLGLIDKPMLEFDCDAVNVLSEMYQDHGDTIALQYGGSFLVNTMETYRGQGGWTSHSRDMLNTLKRFYSNSMLDADKQDAYNLFLGNFVPAEGRPTIWELTTDFYLHNEDPPFSRNRRSYQKWWTFEAINQDVQNPRSLHLVPNDRSWRGRFYEDYYQPNTLISFDKSFLVRMETPADRLIPRDPDNGSPFIVRSAPPRTWNFEISGAMKSLTFQNRKNHDHDRESNSRLLSSDNLYNYNDDDDNYKTRAWETHPVRSVFALPNPTVSQGELSEYTRYVQEFSPHRFSSFVEMQDRSSQNETINYDYNSAEYLFHLRRSYLFDYTLSQHDLDLYNKHANLQPSLPLRMVTKSKYKFFLDYVNGNVRLAKISTNPAAVL